MKKMAKHMVILLGSLLLTLNLTACGNSVEEDLQSHDWTFTSKKGDGMSNVAKFTKNNLTMTEGGFSEVYSYKIISNNSNTSIIFTKDTNTTHEIRKFHIDKEADKYNLTPANKLAKEDTGNAYLVPK